MSTSKLTFIVKALINFTWPSVIDNPKKEVHQLSGTNEKLVKYWSSENRTIGEVLWKADLLYKNKNYIEVYELLNRLKYNNNSEVKWRIARVLYQTTVDNVLASEIEREMIDEAYIMLLVDATEGNLNANVHKWFAIVCDCHHKLLGLEQRIKGYHLVLKHLRIAHKLDPTDVTVSFLLGKLCFDLASIDGFKRFTIKSLYSEPPQSSFEEAYRYLSGIEEITERNFLSNIYYLGRTCYKLNQFYKAKHYLNIVCCMRPKNNYERTQIYDAKQLLNRVEKYTIGKEILYPNYSCD